MRRFFCAYCLNPATGGNAGRLRVYAIIKSGNQQYRVEKGDRIDVERLPYQAGEEVKLTDVVFVGDGDQYRVDKQSLSGASVTARVLDEHKGRKVLAFDYRNKHRRRTTTGHRQLYTRLEITEISLT